MKRKTLALTIMLAFLFSTVTATQFVSLGRANPYHDIWVYEGDAVPDRNTNPPTISILSPEHNDVYAVDTIPLLLRVSTGFSGTASSLAIREIFYKTDWKQNRISVYNYSRDSPYLNPSITKFSETINLTGIPDGNHTMMVYAVESGRYITNRGPEGSGMNPISYAYYYVTFNITGCSSIRFTVDTTPPKVTILSLENKTYNPSDLALNFSVTGSVSQVAYRLDGQANVAISGNMTLSELSIGAHNVTVYATDEAGNTSSQTIYFTISEPFPTVPVLVASIIAVVVMSAGLLLLYRKRRREAA